MAALFLLVAVNAGAQTAPAPPQLIVEKIENGWLFNPDVKVTDLDGHTGTLAGGFIGRIHDRTLVFGGGGYWLTNRDDDFKMAYGGAVVQWLALGNRTIGFGVRTLVGGGSATLPRTLGDLVHLNMDAHNMRNARFGGRPFDPAARVAVNDDFFIVEPQLDVLWNLTSRYRISFGVGYRAIGAAPYLGDQLKGASGSIALQVGGGS
jgi:hypothetical protein